MILWVMVGIQMATATWFSFRGGQLPDKQFIFIMVCWLVGQLGQGIETYQTGSVRTLAMQFFFGGITIMAIVARLRLMRRRTQKETP